MLPQRKIDDDRTMVGDVKRICGGIDLMAQQLHRAIGEHVVQRVGERIAFRGERPAENAACVLYRIVVPGRAVAHDRGGGLLRIRIAMAFEDLQRVRADAAVEVAPADHGRRQDRPQALHAFNQTLRIHIADVGALGARLLPPVMRGEGDELRARGLVPERRPGVAL